jgi:hypothetical protein
MIESRATVRASSHARTLAVGQHSRDDRAARVLDAHNRRRSLPVNKISDVHPVLDRHLVHAEAVVNHDGAYSAAGRRAGSTESAAA